MFNISLSVPDTEILNKAKWSYQATCVSKCTAHMDMDLSGRRMDQVRKTQVKEGESLEFVSSPGGYSVSGKIEVSGKTGRSVDS